METARPYFIQTAAGLDWSEILQWIYSSSFARSSYGRNCIASLGKVRLINWSDKVPTAAIVKKNSFATEIKLNHDFFRKTVWQDDRSIINSAFVLLHEASHALRADFSRFVPELDLNWSRVSNFVSDVVVNAALFNSGFPSRETVTFRLYDPDGLEFFLLPPHNLLKKYPGHKPLSPGAGEGVRESGRLGAGSDFSRIIKPWLGEQVIEKINWKNPGKAEQGFDRLFSAYLAAWSGNLQIDELARRLDELLQSVPALKCIGSHGARGCKGRGDGVTEELKLYKRKEHRIAAFTNILKQALDRNSRSNHQIRAEVNQPGVVPAPDRRSSFLLSHGSWPVFFNNNFESFKTAEQAAHLYLDSSGSMSDDIVDLTARLILGSEGLVAEPVYLFATEVKPVSLKQLRRGLRITGGTRINEVINHARRKKLRRFIVVTDGYVEEISPANKNYLQQADMFVVFERESQQHLAEYATDSWSNVLDYIENRQKRTIQRWGDYLGMTE